MISSIQQVKSVRLVDDDPESRASYEYTVEDAQCEALLDTGPLGSLSEFLSTGSTADAGLCDYDLHTHSYASFSGAELVAEWYRRSFPAVLCTRYEKAQIEVIRPHRRWIPVLLKPDELNPDSLMVSLEECIREMKGRFRPTRRPWRTQVRFLQKDPLSFETYFAELPGWGESEVIKVRLKDLPDPLKVNIREDFRCHATANIGTEVQEDLYLCEWEA